MSGWSVAPPRRVLSEADHEVADDRWLREKRAMPGVHLGDLIGAARKLTLPISRGAPVLRAHHVARGELAPDRCLDGLLSYLHALAREAGGGLVGASRNQGIATWRDAVKL